LEVFCILNEKERKERKEHSRRSRKEKKRKDGGSRDCRSDKSQGTAAAALVSDSLCVSALACVPCRAQGGGKNCSNYRDRVTSGFSTVSLFI